MDIFLHLHHLTRYVYLSDDEPLDVTLDQKSDRAMIMEDQLMSSKTYDLMRLLMGSKNMAELWNAIMNRFEKHSPLEFDIIYGKLQNLQLGSPGN